MRILVKNFTDFNNKLILFLNLKTKVKTIHILKIKHLDLYKIIILVVKFY